MKYYYLPGEKKIILPFSLHLSARCINHLSACDDNNEDTYESYTYTMSVGLLHNVQLYNLINSNCDLESK